MNSKSLAPASTTFALASGLAVAAAAAAPAVKPAPQAGAWEIDSSHSSAAFKVRHLMVSHVKGELGPVTGLVTIDDADLSRSRVDVKIDARAIDTRDAKRDEHLRGADFLDVGNHPTVTFTSSQVKAGKAGALSVTGNLTIRGVTRPITLEVEGLAPAVNDPWGNVKRGATARTSLSRKDFGLTWNMGLETGGVLVGDKVDIEIEVELLARKNKS